ncbi:hypothetical protein C5167_048958 [Papaver somniferum]|uniref:H(+)-exporting diphosphatase n=1 Tax=Papaver somniferum TaxID=3469 RepID=A0A4Y7KMY5_PAPSO|nr:hypothetical protein C5167_048958 [Papaver somniferum]
MIKICVIEEQPESQGGVVAKKENYTTSCKRRELVVAANKFKEECAFGEGGFGGVYKSYLETLVRKESKKAINLLVKDLKVFETFEEKVCAHMTGLLEFDNFRENEHFKMYVNENDARELRLQSLVKQRKCWSPSKSRRIRERADALDAAGNTTAAIEKGFAIGSDVLLYLLYFWCLGFNLQLYTFLRGTTLIKLLLDYVVGDLHLVTFKELESSKNACE